MRVVDRVSAPLVGTRGVAVRIETALVEFDRAGRRRLPPDPGRPTASPAPSSTGSVRSGIGLSDPRSIDGTLSGACATTRSGLGPRLFLIVGVATLLIAILGVFASAVLQSRWRSYEVASLRVVGVSQRTLLRGFRPGVRRPARRRGARSRLGVPRPRPGAALDPWARRRA